MVGILHMEIKIPFYKSKITKLSKLTNSRISLLELGEDPYRLHIFHMASYSDPLNPSSRNAQEIFFDSDSPHGAQSTKMRILWKKSGIVEFQEIAVKYIKSMFSSLCLSLLIFQRLESNFHLIRQYFSTKVSIIRSFGCNFKLIVFLVLTVPFYIQCSDTKAKNPALFLLDGWSSQFNYILSEPGTKNRSDEAISLLLMNLNLAQEKAHCVFEDIDNPNVIGKLRELKSIGRDVQVGMDEDNRTGIGYRQLHEFLPSIGEERKLWIGNKGAGQVYMNFCVIDDRRVFFSTAPPTRIGLEAAPFMAGILQSHEDGIVRKFSGATDLMLHGSFGSSKQRLNQRNHWLIGNTDIGIYMAPEESPVEFLSKRIPGAKHSIQIFTTEFFSNKRVSSTTERTLYDLAYETRMSPVPHKSVVGSWHNDLEVDPSSQGDCSFNDYLGITCNPSKSAGTTSDSPRRQNSLHYLRKHGIEPSIYAGARATNSLNIVLLDAGNPSNMVFVSSHSYSSRGDSSHDGITFVFEDRFNVDRIASFYNSLKSKSLPTNGVDGRGDTGFMSLVISEINWMGGGNTAGSDSSSEWFELYNTTEEAINISGWRFQCGSGGSFTNIAVFPARTIIGSEQYFVVEHSSGVQINSPNIRIGFGGNNSIHDTNTDQCRILDSLGRVIDIAGSTGVPFATRSDIFGLQNIASREYRTMERIRTDIPGENISNWKTNSHTHYTENFNISADFVDRTFGSPGYASSKD